MKNVEKVMLCGALSLLLCNAAQAVDLSGNLNLNENIEYIEGEAQGTSAVECVVQPTCEELGYTQSTSNCYNSNYTACPFDTTKVKCHQQEDCADLGYTQNYSDCIGDKMVRCPYDPSKVMCLQNVSCEDMGFTDNIIECPGEYNVCQYDATKGKCIYEAHPGDLKYSWQVKDHNGWLLCDGRIFNNAQFPELYSAMGSKSDLPNYKNYYLRGATETSVTNFKTSKLSTLPDITGTFGNLRGDTSTYYNSTGAFSTATTTSGSSYNGNSNVTGRQVTFKASSSNSMYGRADPVTGSVGNVNPQHYLANVFIFAGKNKLPIKQDAQELVGKYFCNGTVNNSNTMGNCSIISKVTYSGTLLSFTTLYERSYSYGSAFNVEYATSDCTSRSMTLATKDQVMELFNIPGAISDPQCCLLQGKTGNVLLGSDGSEGTCSYTKKAYCVKTYSYNYIRKL